MTDYSACIPEIISGPLLRRVTRDSIVLWLVTKMPCDVRLTLTIQGEETQHWSAEELAPFCQRVRLADQAHLVLMHVPVKQTLPVGSWVGYQLELKLKSGWQDATEIVPHLTYPNRSSLGFVVQPTIARVLHGSCRKPHHSAGDGLVRADELLATTDESEWPSALVMSGDQVYVDDVATPMLQLIHKVASALQFSTEPLPGTKLKSSEELHHAQPFYQDREALLPKTSDARSVFEGARKPIFTSVNAQNHLVTLPEVLSMYLLVWSPSLWQVFESELKALTPEATLAKKEKHRYEKEKQALVEFAATLPRVQRLLAHIPSAMIFDDHDVTDDWNLTAQWEYDAYGHPLSNRIIGNALIGYFLCQGWGNAPETLPERWVEQANDVLANFDADTQNRWIDELMAFRQWNYRWPTQPALIVLDTRTHRWRSEKLHKPSGLMDFESLLELQRELQNEASVLLVSAAPMFGVKLIEAIQKLFTFFNQPLMVDAENWMAHKGSATTLMNIFHHPNTPRQFVILSGDVHYSFVYDIELRRGDRGQDVWQITSSGIKNEFPERLLNWFDRLNRWLYSPRSPLNWFTQRRALKVNPRKPVGAGRAQRLINSAGIGLVSLDAKGVPVSVQQLCANGQDIAFEINEGTPP